METKPNLKFLTPKEAPQQEPFANINELVSLIMEAAEVEAAKIDFLEISEKFLSTKYDVSNHARHITVELLASAMMLNNAISGLEMTPERQKARKNLVFYMNWIFQTRGLA